LGISLELLCTSGHRKYKALTVEETQKLVQDIREGKIEGAPAGRYFIIQKSTQRPIGELDIKDGQELVMMPVVGGG